MARALERAKSAAIIGESQIGAVLVAPDQTIIAEAHNLCETDHNPTAHAEMLVIQSAAAKPGQSRLPGCDLYVTLEPCPMCAQAISFARIRRLYYAAPDPKGGGVEHGARIFSQPTCHHAPELYPGIGEAAARDILQDFFRQRRDGC